MSSSSSQHTEDYDFQEKSGDLTDIEGVTSPKKVFNKGPKKKADESPLPEEVQTKRRKKDDLENDTNLLQVLSKEQKELISKLVHFQSHYEIFSKDQLKDIAQEFPLGDSDEEWCQRHRHLVHIIAREIRLAKVFFRNFPGYHLIPEEDRTPLLQAAFNGLLLLRWARNYDPASDAVRLLPYHPAYSRSDFCRSANSDTAEEIFDFFKRMNTIKMDDEEFALMQTVVTFSVCPGLREPEEVQKHYNFHLSTLRDLALQKSPQRVWELQSTLNDLRCVASRLIKL